MNLARERATRPLHEHLVRVRARARARARARVRVRVRVMPSALSSAAT